MSAILALQLLTIACPANLQALLGDAARSAGRAIAVIRDEWKILSPRKYPVMHPFREVHISAIVCAKHFPGALITINRGLKHLPAGCYRLSSKAQKFARDGEPIAFQLKHAPQNLERVDCGDWTGWGEAVVEKPSLGFFGIETIDIMTDQAGCGAEYQSVQVGDERLIALLIL